MRVYIGVDDLLDILYLSVIFISMYVLLYRKYIYSILDPLLIYITTLSFSCVLIVNTLLVSQPIYAYHFFVCHFFFFVGFVLVNSKFKISTEKPSHIKFIDYANFRLLLYALLTFYVLTNTALFFTTGFALLSDDPSRAKVEDPQIGYAIISQINVGISSFLLSGLFFLLFYKPRFSDVALLIIVILLSSLSGAKGALIQVGIIMGLIVNHPIFKKDQKIKLMTKLMTPVIVIVMVAIPSIVYTKETGDSEQSIVNFITRLMMSADSTLYFYQPVNEQYFAQFHFWDYPAYLFNGILDFLRIRQGIEAHGDTMLRNVINNYSVIAAGPNTPYYIEGQIYFGYYGAFIYSLIIGGLLAFSRYYFFNKEFTSMFSFAMVACIVNHLSAIYGEVTLGFFGAFLSLFFVLPIYFFIKFFISGKGKFVVKNHF